MAHIWTSWDKGGAMTEEWMRGRKKKEKMEVRWLLTNRKHGGKTKSVSVLKAALKRRDGKKQKDDC